MRLRSISRAAALAAVGGAVLGLPASAFALNEKTVAVKVVQDYSIDGVIDPCKHTSDELKLVLKIIPADIEQYAPDYPAAIEAALAARARGECAGKKPQAAPLPIPAKVATPPPVVTPEPTPVPTAIPTKTVVPEPPQPAQAPAGSIPVAQAKPSVELQRVATATPANETPAPLLLLALLAGLLLVSAVFLATMRRLGWADERLAGPRHAFAEAAWRIGGLAEDFRDWLRLGR